jgi:hypothetical protein
MGAVSNNNNIQPDRFCKYGCGKPIKWNKSQNAYVEINTNRRHICPDWNPIQKRLSDSLGRKITTEQQIYVDTLCPILLKLLSEFQDLRSEVQEISGL